jgi:hypothetical protein
MKTKYLLAAVLLLLVTNTVSYLAGSYNKDLQSEKDYQTACVLNDCCRNMVDNIGVDAEEIYCDYLDNLDCDSLLTVTRGDLETYYWCY